MVANKHRKLRADMFNFAESVRLLIHRELSKTCGKSGNCKYKVFEIDTTLFVTILCFEVFLFISADLFELIQWV